MQATNYTLYQAVKQSANFFLKHTLQNFKQTCKTFTSSVSTALLSSILSIAYTRSKQTLNTQVKIKCLLLNLGLGCSKEG